MVLIPPPLLQHSYSFGLPHIATGDTSIEPRSPSPRLIPAHRPALSKIQQVEMSSLVSSVGNMVEAGVKGLIGLAETYYNSEDEGVDDETSERSGPATGRLSTPSVGAGSAPPIRPVPINTHERSDTATTLTGPGSNTASSTSTSPSIASSSIVSKPIVSQGSLVQLLDVPSGWIHLQSTYLDGAGARKVRSFGLRNLADADVDVSVASDLDGQILFWAIEDEKGEALGAFLTPTHTRYGLY